MQLDLIPLFLGGLRGWQLILVVLLAIMLFGANKIPKMMRNLGKGVHSFKQGLSEAQEEINKPVAQAPRADADKDTKVADGAKDATSTSEPAVGKDVDR